MLPWLDAPCNSETTCSAGFSGSGMGTTFHPPNRRIRVPSRAAAYAGATYCPSVRVLERPTRTKRWRIGCRKQ